MLFVSIAMPVVRFNSKACKFTSSLDVPALSGIFLRTMYRSDYYMHNPAYIEHYILRAFHKASKRRSNNPCKSVYIAGMALLMRHNGTKKSGWTDGLHPGP